MRVRNFCAGPAVIAESVLEEVKSELLEWGDSGMSIMEMSHRSSIYDEVAMTAKKDFISPRWSHSSILNGSNEFFIKK